MSQKSSTHHIPIDLQSLNIQYFLPFSLIPILLILTSACGGATQLNGQLKEAQREREVLRDAYESQQLRLRELESRLLQLEDQGPRVADRLRGHQGRSTPTNTTHVSRIPSEEGWRERRLRALPVVMVKRDSPDWEQTDSLRDRRQQSAHRLTGVNQIKSKKRASQLKRMKSRFIRKTSVSTASSLPPKPPKSTHITQTPSLTTDNLKTFGRSPPAIEAVPPSISTRDSVSVTRMLTTPTAGSASTKASASPTAPSPEPKSPKESGHVLLKNAIQQPTEVTVDQAGTLLTMADTQRRAGQYIKASRTLNRLIAEYPTHPLIPDALYAMGRIQIEKGEQTTGRSTLLRLSRLYPSARAAKAARKFLKGEGS